MPRKAEINLHAIDREFRRVLAKLDTARKGTDKSGQQRLARLLQKLQGAHAQTTSICPKALSVWPEAVTAVKARAAKKPGRK